MKNIHLLYSYLAKTQNWLYELFKEMVNPLVISEYTKNLQEFPYTNLIGCDSKLSGIPGKIETKLKYYYRVNREISSSGNIPVVHSHFGHKGYKDSKFIFCDCRHVVSFYGYDASMLLGKDKWRRRYRKLSKKSDKFLVLGKNMKEKFVNIGIPEDKIKIFHLGVDLNKLEYNLKIPSKDERTVFLIASSFNKKKGIPTAIKAFNKFYQNNRNCELRIIGDIPNRSKAYVKYKNRILDLINKTEAKKNIKLMGYVSYEELIENMMNAHFLLHPSVTEKNGNQEGTPMAIINSMGIGTLVLSTFHSDIPEIIKHKEEGLLVEERDYESLAGFMQKYSNDADKYKSIVKNARKKIEKEFNVKKQSKKLMEIYKSLE